MHPPEVLRDWLLAIAPDAAARISPGDRYRTLRALEAALAVGEIQEPPGPGVGRAREEPVRLAVVVLEAAPDALAGRISARVHAMFKHGLIEEALSVRREYGDAPALTGIGYAEALSYVDGTATRADAVSRTIERTRAYAKRQRTWFRRIADAVRLDALDERTPHALAQLARGFARTT
jgi:tRNA dimethylallyltransferase